jgi:hypothetical protein
MKAFEVLVDGNHIRTVGVRGDGIIVVNLDCNTDPSKPSRARLSVGGIDDASGQNFEWPEASVDINSEILIRFIDTDEVDEFPTP